MAALLIIREEHVTGHFVLMENQTNADNRMDIVPSLNGSMFFSLVVPDGHNKSKKHYMLA